MSRLRKRCLPTYEALKDAIGQSPVVTADETSWRVTALAAWMWHFTAPTLALYGIRSGRGDAGGHAAAGDVHGRPGQRRLGSLSVLPGGTASEPSPSWSSPDKRRFRLQMIAVDGWR